MAGRESTALKLKANAQRRFRDAFLPRLRASIRAPLEAAEFLVAPDSVQHIQAVFPYTEGREEILSAPGYSYCELERSCDAISVVSDVAVGISNMEALLRPGDQAPLFRIRLDWGLANFVRLYEDAGPPLWLWTEDLSTGLIIDSFGDAERCEVFQVAKWGTA